MQGAWAQGVLVQGAWAQGVLVQGAWAQGVLVQGAWAQGVLVQGAWAHPTSAAHAQGTYIRGHFLFYPATPALAPQAIRGNHKHRVPILCTNSALIRLCLDTLACTPASSWQAGRQAGRLQQMPVSDPIQRSRRPTCSQSTPSTCQSGTLRPV